MKPVSNPDYYRHAEWISFYDADCDQYQVIDEAKVIATGIETLRDAKIIAAAPELLKQRDALLAASREMARLIPSMDWSGCIESHNHVADAFNALTDAIALCETENR